ncbi:hypothetical protein FIBSPDRAFT_887282 [Athelia psychrophila]|uniref:Uncharacterized protein n=1 Tax=Athelia psychrophila TaxID=1759441 RepID=A0A166PVH9_9AGAM|nr:hypothetical protein FIBSPDRAFT_887282 [Fibularhizoctonia sp. CBS 109695]
MAHSYSIPGPKPNAGAQPFPIHANTMVFLYVSVESPRRQACLPFPGPISTLCEAISPFYLQRTAPRRPARVALAPPQTADRRPQTADRRVRASPFPIYASANPMNGVNLRGGRESAGVPTRYPCLYLSRLCDSATLPSPSPSAEPEAQAQIHPQPQNGPGEPCPTRGRLKFNWLILLGLRIAAPSSARGTELAYCACACAQVPLGRIARPLLAARLGSGDLLAYPVQCLPWRGKLGLITPRQRRENGYRRSSLLARSLTLESRFALPSIVELRALTEDGVERRSNAGKDCKGESNCEVDTVTLS